MAGNTGRLTSEQLAARGPRKRLLCLYRGRVRIGFFIALEGDGAPLRGDLRYHRSPVYHLHYKTFACSYSLAYLLRIGKANKDPL